MTRSAHLYIAAIASTPAGAPLARRRSVSHCSAFDLRGRIAGYVVPLAMSIAIAATLAGVMLTFLQPRVDGLPQRHPTQAPGPVLMAPLAP